MVAVGTAAVGALVALGGGGFGLARVRRAWRRRRELAAADDARAGSLSPGVTQLRGEVRPAEETFTSPLTGQECVAYQYTVEERQRRAGGESGGRNRRWVTVTEDERAAPFYVDDGTGAALVDAPAAEFRLERAYEVDTRESVSAAAEGLVATMTTGATGDEVPVAEERREEIANSDRRRYRERLVRPGESVYAYGEAVPPGAAGGEHGGVGDALAGAAGLLASGDEDASLFDAALGGNETFRRAKRRDHTTEEPQAPSDEDIAEMRAAAEELRSMQRDPEEMSPEQRRRMQELAETMQGAGMTDGPMAAFTQGLPGAIHGQGGAEHGEQGALAGERLVVSRGDAVGEFVLSDREKGDVLRSQSTGVLRWLAVAVASFVAGGALLARGLGVLPV